MASQKEKKKSSNFTVEEQELLMALVREHKDVIDNKKSGQVTWDMKNNVWNEIEQEFNSHSKGTFRDALSLKTKYRNMKKECKQKFSANKKSMMATGGGPPDKVEINEVDMEMKDIMGETSIHGLPGLHDDDGEDDETQQNQVEEIIHIEYVDGLLDEMRVPYGEDINDKLITPNNSSLNSGIAGNTCGAESSQTGPRRNWSQYSTSMLQEPVNKKLKTDNDAKTRVSANHQPNRTPRTKTLACTKSQLYEQVMQAKLDFIKLQKEKFLEEHALKMKVHKMEFQLKKQQLLDKGIISSDHESE